MFDNSCKIHHYYYVEFVLLILYVAINALLHSFKEEGSCSNVPFVFLSCMALEKKPLKNICLTHEVGFLQYFISHRFVFRNV
jgi:hypothetical protein